MVDLRKVDIRRAIKDRPYRDEILKVRCPRTDLHLDNEASVAVYRDHVHCHACHRFHISRRMESLAFLLGCSVTEAIKRAGDYLEIEGQVEREEIQLPPLSASLVDCYESLLHGYRKDRLSWLYERGFTNETIQRLHLGHDGLRFTIPVFGYHGNLVTFRFRRDDKFTVRADEMEDEKQRAKYAGVWRRNDPMLYPEWLFPYYTQDYLIVAEGELDAGLLNQLGFQAVTLTNGAGNLSKILDLLQPYGQFKRLILATDADSAGRKAASEMRGAARVRGYEVRWFWWPRQWAKDITELVERKQEYAVNKLGALTRPTARQDTEELAALVV
jgi:5S rRNA maturation endonuclease (ribonuclease M5)